MILIYLLALFSGCNPYKILVMNPKYAYSHMNIMGKIADTLVEAGHEVVFGTTRAFLLVERSYEARFMREHQRTPRRTRHILT
ncbi:hypothetical protein GCK32_021548, partial [Trichostrongylus colubriformis]